MKKFKAEIMVEVNVVNKKMGELIDPITNMNRENPIQSKKDDDDDQMVLVITMMLVLMTKMM